MPEYMGKLMTQLLRLGLLPFITDNRIHTVPPAIVTPKK
jgi:taurine--2-oxoglutarate transaminase